MFVVFFLAFLASVRCWPTTVPFWPQYPTRHIQVLDGSWQFGYSETADPLTVNPRTISTPQTVTVPNSFDVSAPGVLGRRGTAFYRTTFTATPNTPLLLNFAACAFYCRVFIDDEYVGEHRAGGYNPFWLTVNSTSTKTIREIFVVANNQWNSTLSPTQTGGDFWAYGGITRNVIVHERPQPLYIQRVETFTKKASPGIIDVSVVLGSTSSSSVKLSLAWDGASPSSPITVPVTGGVASLKALSVPNSKPWFPSSPNLHTLTVNVYHSDTIVDAIKVRFGLRTLGFGKDKGSTRVSINDQIIKFHGINRHTMWPDTGSALTLEQVQEDVKLLQKLNANYVRGAHYPQDQRFLDLCDEKGILIWEEALGPGVTTKDIENPYFMKYQLQAIEEMVTTSINHPSIVFHAFFNEGPSNDPKACVGYKASADKIRSLVGTNPPSRYVTWANDHLMGDVCLDNADVISFNSYPAWYYDPRNLKVIVPFWTEQLREVQAKYPEKPFTISEAGAGGVYEWTNSTDVFWSQKYQSEVVEITAQFAVSHPLVTGLTIWQFSDIKADDGSTRQCGQCHYEPHPPSLSVPWTCAYISVNCGRPGGENHKGQVDFWRREKETFASLSKVYATANSANN